MEKYSRNQQIIDGELGDNQVMMHIDKNKYFGLNAVGKRIWEFAEQPKSFQELTDLLQSEFEVTKDQCIQEVQLFLDKAILCDILVKKEVDD
ncbi:MAG: PqqD family peptide modification chaperone [Bacteroidales bacterium]|nr:PqqD family peptide modification chaperone [Bacteroidales bacterium]